MEGRARPNSKTEVYALGLTLYHIAFGVPPFAHLPQDKITAAVISGHRPSVDLCDYNGAVYPELADGTGPSSAMLKLIADCWTANRHERPTAKEVVERLEDMESDEASVRGLMNSMINKSATQLAPPLPVTPRPTPIPPTTPRPSVPLPPPPRSQTPDSNDVAALVDRGTSIPPPPPYDQLPSSEYAQLSLHGLPSPVPQPLTDPVAFAEARWQTVLQSANWEDEFNAHIARVLEESGYPRRLAYNNSNDKFELCPAPVPSAGAPPLPVVLWAMQNRACNRVLTNTVKKVAKWKGTPTSDVVMSAGFYDISKQTRVQYSMVIRLNDKRYPANAAHFRTAAATANLGQLMHQCFVPSGQTAASLPYVAMYKHCQGTPCAQTLQLPNSDIVYGEYAAPPAGSNAAYPVGTVLMYPRCTVPLDRYSGHGRDTPWFIAVKPCPVGLLRGAVPVGHVLSCVPGTEATTQDNSANPFNADVLRCLEWGIKLKTCSTYSCISFTRLL